MKEYFRCPRCLFNYLGRYPVACCPSCGLTIRLGESGRMEPVSWPEDFIAEKDSADMASSMTARKRHNTESTAGIPWVCGEMSRIHV